MESHAADAHWELLSASIDNSRFLLQNRKLIIDMPIYDLVGWVWVLVCVYVCDLDSFGNLP